MRTLHQTPTGSYTIRDNSAFAPEGTYAATGRCSNCGEAQSVSIKRGVEKPKFGLTCPACGCGTLKVY